MSVGTGEACDWEKESEPAGSRYLMMCLASLRQLRTGSLEGPA